LINKDKQLRERSYGLVKHFLIGFVFLLGCYSTTFAGFAIPILISLAVSAATAGATYLITALTAPKPKPQDKGKLQGEIQLSNVGEDLAIPEIYGARGADGFGGIRTGVIFFHASEIRDVPTTITSGGGGRSGKGGGGGNSSRSQGKEHHYFIDLACMVGLNRTRVLEIKAGTDVLYRNYPQTGTAIAQSVYEAETAPRGGSAAVVADSTFSGGSKVDLGATGTLSFIVTGDGQPHAFYIYYKCAGDKTLDVAINGLTQTVTLPDSFGRIESVILTGTTNTGATTVYLAANQTGISIDKISVGETFSSDAEDIRFGGISGTIDPGFINPNPGYGDNDLPLPTFQDWRPMREYNYQGNPNAAGETAAQLPNGCQLRIYEGTDTQLPDPLLQEFYEAKYGAGATPAFRYRAYFVLENFEITKYGSVPNITVVSESLHATTLGAIYRHRSQRAGLAPAETDYTALDGIPVRGYVIAQRQAPKAEMEILDRILDVDVFEDTSGVIKGVVPSDEVSIQIPFTDLDVKEDGEDNSKPVAIETVVRNEYELPRRMDLSYFDPSKQFEIGNTHASREITVSEKRENIETSLVLTEGEAKKMVDRLHQKEWAEKDAESFETFYRYGWLNPTDLVEVEDLTGVFNRIRLKVRNGSIPGKLKFGGVSRDLPEPLPRIFTETQAAPHRPPSVVIPPNIVGTLADIAILRTTETVPGVYAACAMTDSAYKFDGAALMWKREAGYQILESFDKQATFGKTLTTPAGNLGDVPAGWSPGIWDTVSSLTFDLYFGEVETRTDAEVLDRFNVLIVGNEVIAFTTAARVAGFPNRWTVSRLRRRLKGTGSQHIAGERVLLLTDAVKFIPLDVSEFDRTRNYKFVSSGQNISSASVYAFTWSGATKYNTAANQTTDNGAPVLSSNAPVVSLVGTNWSFKFQKPVQNGYTAALLEYRLVNTTAAKTLAAGVSATSTSLTLNNATGLPPTGKVVIGGETIGYGSISGGGLNALERGAEHTAAASHALSAVVKPVSRQSQLGDVLEVTTPQLADTFELQYRWRNGYLLNGSDGWSFWSSPATAYGSANAVQPGGEVPPPSEPPPPPPGYEDPYDPNSGWKINPY